MKKKLECIMLVDDHQPTNVLHQFTIDELACAEVVQTFTSGARALEYLQDVKAVEYVRPSIIFLDLNMPGVNGWDFLEQYETFPEDIKSDVILVMLTTSLSPRDQERALETLGTNSFISKPLTVQNLEAVLKVHFPDYF